MTVATCYSPLVGRVRRRHGRGDGTYCHPTQLAALAGARAGSAQPSPLVDLACYYGLVVLSLRWILVDDRIARQSPCLAGPICAGCPAAAGFVGSVQLPSLVVATFHSVLVSCWPGRPSAPFIARSGLRWVPCCRGILSFRYNCPLWLARPSTRLWQSGTAAPVVGDGGDHQHIWSKDLTIGRCCAGVGVVGFCATFILGCHGPQLGFLLAWRCRSTSGDPLPIGL